MSFLKIFIYLSEREGREHKQGEGQREKERKRGSRLPAERGASRGA